MTTLCYECRGLSGGCWKHNGSGIYNAHGHQIVWPERRYFEGGFVQFMQMAPRQITWTPIYNSAAARGE